MKCKKCGNDTFIAHQICRMDIMVDEFGEFLRNLDGGAEMHIYDSGKPYGPFTCSKCGAEYDELTKDDASSTNATFDDDHDDGENSQKICREIGHCPILGEHSNPTVFDCDTLCAARKNDN